MGLAALAVSLSLLGFGSALPSRAANADAAGIRLPWPFVSLPREFPALFSLPSRPVRKPLAGARLGESAVLLRETVLRRTPGRTAIALLDTHTEFGSPRVLAVVGRRGAWLAVLATELPNGAVGWIRATDASLVSDPYKVEVDVAHRTMTVFRGGRVAHRAVVAVGAGDTPTPTGRFATTDKLTVAGPSPYGCCILALSGHQTHLARGWQGGDRLAIHSTDEPGTVGYAASLGCLRALGPDARWLIDNVPLGTVVTIH